MEDLKKKLNKLIKEKGLSSSEVLELSRKIYKFIIDYYKRNAGTFVPTNL